MAKAKAKSQQPQIYDVVDEFLALPPEQAHLCAAQADEGDREGVIRLMLNRDVLDIMQDIVDELELSRQLPVEAREIQMTDPVVVQILQKEAITDIRDAHEKAVGWYNRQKKQVQNDALIIALTLYNEFNIVPVPYKSGEIAFSVRESTDQRRKLPAWMENRAATQIPLPERRLSNMYEMRLKQIYDISKACGSIWALSLGRAFEEGIAKTIRLLEPRDDAGFPVESPDTTLHAESGTPNGN